MHVNVLSNEASSLDSQMDAEEKENTPVEKREEGEDDDIKKGVGSSDQIAKDTVASGKKV